MGCLRDTRRWIPVPLSKCWCIRNGQKQWLYIHIGDLYGTHRFWRWLAERQRDYDHRGWALIRAIPFLPHLVRPGWHHTLSDPGERFRHPMVQKRAQATRHPIVRPWEDVDGERQTDHRSNTTRPDP